MSRFFATGLDSDSDTSSSDEETIQKPVAVTATKTLFSDSEEETKRVVRSAKDKRYEEIREIIYKLRNHKKIKDMSKILTDFEDLGRAYDKARKVVEREGIPRFYIRCLSELDDFVNTCWEDREGRKQMSKNNAKGLTTLRQKLRRYNRDFETEIAAYKENPDQGDEEEEEAEEEEEDSDSEAEGMTAGDFLKKPTPAEKAPAANKFLKSAGKNEEDSDSDSSFWDSDSDSDTSSSDDDAKYEGNLAAKFLKKSTDDRKTETKVKKDRKVKKARIYEDKDDDGDWEEVKGGLPAVTEKPKMFNKDAEINHEAVLKKLLEIVAARGKKGTDRTEQINLLHELRAIASEKALGSAIDVKILFNVIAAIYDYNPNIATCMKPEMWEQCLQYNRELLDVLSANPSIIVGENISDESEVFEGEGPFRVRGCALTMVERMDEEFVKMLQACDAHSTEYVERLKDEGRVCSLIADLQEYIEGRGTSDEICRVYLKRGEHIYYKFDYKAMKREPDEEIDEKTDSRMIMDRLCKYIYAKDNTDRIRTRAILYHIYHHAMHDRWYEARDLMLMSHLQDTIQHSDIPTQIVYNRSMVQLGLCAFRAGMIRDAHNCLVDIQSGGRAKELLAQGLLLQRQHERTPEQEKIEKRRQMPYHMHINLELLECVYLVSAMLLEIPYMAAHEFDARRRMISKNFHHVLRVSERNPLVGPPESMREHVVAASKAMKNGDPMACKKFIINDKMKAKVWDLFHKSAEVCTMVEDKIQEESLRTYLFTYSSVYDSLSLQVLAEMFGLQKNVVHSIISKMIINEELMASLDEPTQTVVMHRTEPTRLQSLALQLSEKVSSLVDNNERMMEMKSGTFFGFQKGFGGRDQGDGYRGRQGYGQQGGQYRGRRDYQGGGDRDRGGGGRRDYQGGGGRRDYQGDRGGGGYQGGGYHGGGRRDYQGGGGGGRRGWENRGNY